MRIPKETEATILRLYHAEKWKIGTIAAQLCFHYDAVRRVLRKNPQFAPGRRLRPSIVDPYIPFIVETLTRYPSLPASRPWHMARERGFVGSLDHLRAHVSHHRPPG